MEEKQIQDRTSEATRFQVFKEQREWQEVQQKAKQDQIRPLKGS